MRIINNLLLKYSMLVEFVNKVKIVDNVITWQ